MKKFTILCVCLIIAGMFLSCVSSSGTMEETKGTKANTELFEDFEATHYFIAVGDFWKDGDNSLAAITTEEHATSGSKALECQFLFKENNKGAAFYGEGFEKFDWIDYSKLVVDVFNATDDELTFAFAVCTGSTWFWIESETFPLSSGMNKDFTFDLSSKTYKSSLTSWENSTTLADMDDVKRLIFKINGPVGLEGSVFLDNIRLIK